MINIPALHFHSDPVSVCFSFRHLVALLGRAWRELSKYLPTRTFNHRSRQRETWEGAWQELSALTAPPLPNTHRASPLRVDWRKEHRTTLREIDFRFPFYPSIAVEFGESLLTPLCLRLLVCKIERHLLFLLFLNSERLWKGHMKLGKGMTFGRIQS